MIKFRTIIFILAITIGLFGVASHTKAATINSSLLNKGGSLTSGLVGWWTMDAQDMAGTQVYDKSGNNNTGTRNGGTSAVIGKLGQALKFNGSTGYIDGGSSTSFQLTTGSLSAWIKTTNAGSSYRAIVDKPIRYGIFLQDNIFGIYDWQAGIFRSTGILLNDGKWHYVAATFQSGITNGTYLYIDGILKLTTTITINADTANITIGQNSGVQFFNGSIDDVRVYNRTLSAGEVKQLYNQTAGTIAATTVGKGGSLASGLVTHFTFDANDTADATVYDKGTGGNNGTIGSGAAKTSGKFGQALNFSGRGAGQDPSFTFGTNVLADISNPFSISGWTFLNGFSKMTYPKMITLDSNGADAAPFEITFANIPGSYLGVLIGSPSTWKRLMTNTPGSSLTKNWHHIVATYNGAGAGTAANFKVYIDGVSQTLSNANAYSALTNANTVGTGPTGGSSNAWDGKIDEIRIYNRALSAAEVNKLYALGRTTANKSAAIHPASGGLVGWWTFDGQDMDATKIYDKSGQNNTGTINGGVTKTIGKLGQAMKFDGSTGYVDTNKGILNFITASAGTISLWVKPTGISPVVSNVYDGRAIFSNSQGSIVIGQATIGGLDRIWVQNYVAGEQRVGITYNLGQWTHIVWEHINGVLYAYKNGVLVGSVASGDTAGATSVYIGSGFGQKLQGSIDDVRVYNRALSAAEIKQLYNATK